MFILKIQNTAYVQVINLGMTKVTGAYLYYIQPYKQLFYTDDYYRKSLLLIIGA